MIRFPHLAALSLLSLSVAAQAPIANGHLVVVRFGDGVAALTNVSTPTFLEEFDTAGTPIQTIPLPTAASGANLPFTNSGTSTSEGFLTLSQDGNYLVLAGYGTVPGSIGSVVTTTSAAVPRVVARVALNGTIDTSTSTNSAFSAGNPRSVCTDNGTNFWMAGSNSGAQYLTFGATSSTQLNSTAPTNLRVAQLFGGQLYVSSASGTVQGVATVGVGIPTTSGQAVVLLPGFPITTQSNYDYFFADANTVFVADDRTTGGAGGIQKWTFSGGLWSLQYTLIPALNIGCRGITGSNVGGVATLYATTTNGQLVSVVDNGLGVFTTLATAATNTAYRGVRLVESHGSISFGGAGSPTSVGIPTIGATGGNPSIGNLAFAATGGNMPAFTLAGLWISVPSTLIVPGIPIPGAQPGADLIAGFTLDLFPIVFADAVGNAINSLPLPPVPSFIGVPIGMQWLVLDGAIPFPLQIGTSQGMLVVLGAP